MKSWYRLGKVAEKDVKRRRFLDNVTQFATTAVAMVLTTMMKFMMEPERPGMMIAITAMVLAFLLSVTTFAKREQAGPKPLARITDTVTEAYLAGLEASALNPKGVGVSRG